MRQGIALLGAILAGLLPASATGAVGTATFSSPATSELSVKASNGYVIDVVRFNRQVSLTAYKPQAPFVSASYFVRGRASAKNIDASFGKLGRISVKLRTRRIRRRPPRRGCTGKVATTRHGVFVGTIRFRGEGGYTTVDTRRARGEASSAVRETCPFFPRNREATASGGRRHTPELTALFGRRLGFVASAPNGSTGLRRALFEAAVGERRGRIEIVRVASAVSGPDRYVFADNLMSATVRPPKPFEGDATFERLSGGRTSWLGSLSVSFPGREDVRLAGSRFSATLRPFEP